MDVNLWTFPFDVLQSFFIEYFNCRKSALFGAHAGMTSFASFVTQSCIGGWRIADRVVNFSQIQNKIADFIHRVKSGQQAASWGLAIAGFSFSNLNPV